MMDDYTLKLTSKMDAKEMEPHWPVVFDHLDKYVQAYPRHCTVETIMEKLVAGDLQLWIVIDNKTGENVLSALTEIKTALTTGENVLGVFATAGEGEHKMGPLFDDVIKWAQKNYNVTGAEIQGKPGIAKLLRPYGFKQQSVIMTKGF